MRERSTAVRLQTATVEAFGRPLVMHKRDIPTPGAGQMLVETGACGVCRTELHAARGGWPVKPSLPFVPDHEGIGLVAAIGAGVTGAKEGDRVGVPWLYSACRTLRVLPFGLGDGVRPGSDDPVAAVRAAAGRIAR